MGEPGCRSRLGTENIDKPHSPAKRSSNVTGPDVSLVTEGEVVAADEPLTEILTFLVTLEEPSQVLCLVLCIEESVYDGMKVGSPCL